MTDPTPPVEAVLVYDGECPQCDHAAGALRAAPRFAAMSWHETEAQEALAAQFSEAPSAMALFDRSSGQVYGADLALAELSKRTGSQSFGERFSGPEHAHDAGAIGDAGAGAGAVRDAEGVHALTPAARARLPALIAAAERDDTA